MSRPLVIAHRGDSAHRPENTLAAFSAALERGADGVECDVRLCADGAPVVFHDEEVSRTTNGRGRVAAMSLAELKKLDAGEGERIPTLAEAADLLRGRALLCLEFKEAGAVAPALELLRGFPKEQLIVCGFDPVALRRCKELRSEVPALLIIGSLSLNPATRWREAFPLRTVRRAGADGLSCHHAVLSRSKAGKIRRAGLGLVVWSALSEERDPPGWFARACEFRPDALVTSWPGRLVEFLTEQHPS